MERGDYVSFYEKSRQNNHLEPLNTYICIIWKEKIIKIKMIDHNFLIEENGT